MQEAYRYLILAVDDNPTNLSVVFDIFENMPIKVLMARDGHSAIDKALLARPHLILLDIMMPGIDGLETCRQLKERAEVQDIPIIFMTAIDAVEHKVQAFSAGAVDYVTKPLQHEEVRARVSSHLRIAELTRSLALRSQELELRNSELRQEIETRKQLQAERDAMQVHLLKMARRNGMADVVGSFLHNLGNALTTALTSLAAVGDTTGEDNAERMLLRIVARMEEQKEPETHAKAPVGRQVAVALNTVAASLGKLRRRRSSELDRCRGAVERMQHILKWHTRFAQVEEMVEEFDPREVIDEAVAVVQRSFTAAGITLEQDLCAVPRMRADRFKLFQLLLELLTNARQAVESCDVAEQRVSLAMDVKDGQVQITVRDTGCGIEPQHLPEVFHLEFSTKGAGHGLGLHHSAILAEQLGGSLEATSHGLGRGATFIVQIPVATEQLP